MYTPGYPSAMGSTNHESSPPFDPQKNFAQVTTREGDVITPTLDCKVDKGFFLSGDNTFTCYRRNYFSVQCSYRFDPYPSDKELCLEIDGKRHRINVLAVTLSAAVDAPNGKGIELVQYTPKRDQGEKWPVEKKKLLPTTPGGYRNDGHNAAVYSMTSSFTSALTRPPYLAFQNTDESSASREHSSVPTSGNPNMHIFERVQFKSATANNGKRRAQQQFYHLNIELLADVRTRESDKPVWKKIAQRTSHPVVVRGRSPSHYSKEDPQHGSSSNRGAGGAGAGGSGGGSYGFSSAGSALGNSLSRSYAMGTSGYSSGHSHLAYNSGGLSFLKEENTSPNSSTSSLSASPHDGTVATSHDISGKIERGNYSYFTDALRRDRAIKDEYVLSPTGTNHSAFLTTGGASTCGRFVGIPSSAGVYAADTAQY